MKNAPVTISVVIAIAISLFFMWQRLPESVPTVSAMRQSRNKDVSSAVSRIQDQGRILSERLKAAREISTDLTNQELKELMVFLSKPLDQENASSELLAINQVMDQLRVSGMACGEYANALCGLIRDSGTNSVVRDYALQHAVQWMREARHGSSPVKLEEVDRRHILDCMVAYLQDPRSLLETGFGTTLNLIRTLEPEYPQDAAEIVALCSSNILSISSGEQAAPLGNRIAAIQSLPLLNDHETARKLVRGILNSSEIDSPIRLVTIATLGVLGDEKDLETLRKIQGEDEGHSYAARTALERLTTNLALSTR